MRARIASTFGSFMRVMSCAASSVAVRSSSMIAIMYCMLMSGMCRLLTVRAPWCETRTTTFSTSSALKRCSLNKMYSESSGACIGLPTVQRLMLVFMISNVSPKPRVASSGFAFGPNAKKRLRSPENASSIPVMPDATIVAAVAPLRAGMPPKINAFSICSVSRA